MSQTVKMFVNNIHVVSIRIDKRKIVGATKCGASIGTHMSVALLLHCVHIFWVLIGLENASISVVRDSIVASTMPSPNEFIHVKVSLFHSHLHLFCQPNQSNWMAFVTSTTIFIINKMFCIAWPKFRFVEIFGQKNLTNRAVLFWMVAAMFVLLLAKLFYFIAFILTNNKCGEVESYYIKTKLWILFSIETDVEATG